MPAVRMDHASSYTPPARRSRGLRGFSDALAAESDHSCALLASAGLDALLTELCWARMVPSASLQLFEGAGPLAGFAAKIDLAFSLGWISGAERADLHGVRVVAIRFAHDLDRELSFSADAIRTACEPFQLANAFLAEAGLPDSMFAQEMIGEFRTNARHRFEMTVEFLRQALVFRAAQAAPPTELPDAGS